MAKMKPKECQNVEYKQSWHDKYLEWICGFANAQGAVMYFEGELPTGYTPETLLAQHSSKPRNRNIANAFFKAGFIDAWGRGYKKIREGFENVGLPMPVIETADGGVKVTFQRRNQGNPISDFGKDFGKELSERQLLILELIALDPSLSAKAISEKVSEKMSEKVSGKASITARAIENDMAKLKKLGILTHEGSRKEGRWIIVKTKLSK